MYLQFYSKMFLFVLTYFNALKKKDRETQLYTLSKRKKSEEDCVKIRL